jgi:serine/threonine protein phosphatase PrpC
MLMGGILFWTDGISVRNGRETNMDSLLLAERTIGGVPAALAVVCDGVGSMSDGAYASVTSVRLLNEWFGRIEGAERAGLRLRDEVLSVNAEVLSAASADGLQTATTLSALLLVGERYFIVHAGDSRIYSVGASEISPLTVDMVTQTGKLTSCVGRFDSPELFYSEGEIRCDAFLLCSDGLYKRIDEARIARTLDINSRKAIVKTLKSLSEAAVAQGERDNISIAIVKPVK